MVTLGRTLARERTGTCVQTIKGASEMRVDRRVAGVFTAIVLGGASFLGVTAEAADLKPSRRPPEPQAAGAAVQRD